MLFMHGGGYAFGSPNGHRKLTAHLAKACNVPALSIDYRMVPEHPFPAPLDDCVSAYKYLLDQGYAPGSIVLAGDSCGGGLVSAVPLEARKRGLPLPGASVALSPWMDLTLGSESLETNKELDVLGTKPFVDTLADMYTNGDKELRKNPVVSPLYGDLEGLNLTGSLLLDMIHYSMMRLGSMKRPRRRVSMFTSSSMKDSSMFSSSWLERHRKQLTRLIVLGSG